MPRSRFGTRGGKLRFLLKGHTDSAYWLDWSPDSSALVTGSWDGTAKVWGITDQGASELMTLAPQEGTISGVAFSGDGTQVMTGSETSAVKIWDVGPTGDAEWANVPNDGDVMFARGGSELITSSIVDGTVTALDIDTGRHRPIGSLPRLGMPAVYHDLSPDGVVDRHRLRDPLTPELSVRDVATGDELFAVDDRRRGVDWSPSGEYVAWTAAESSRSTIVRGTKSIAPGRRAGQFGPRGLIAMFGGTTPSTSGTGDGKSSSQRSRPYLELVAFDPTGERIATDDLEIWDVAQREGQPVGSRIRCPRSPPSHSARTAPASPWAAAPR